ncbi:hypothetical protein ACHAWX_004986 [Stephanocyclus meneghinianus]
MKGPSLGTVCIYTVYLSPASIQPTGSFHLPNHRRGSPRPSRREPTELFYYKPDLPLSSRLSEIKSELSTLKSRGIDKFLLDEIAAAQKRLSNDVRAAEKYADGIVKKGRGEEGKLMREAMRSSGNDESVTVLVNGLKGVRQELEEVRGVNALGEVAVETAKNDLLLEKDMLSVTEKVASSLKEAEMAIKSSVVTLSSGEISDDDKEEVLKQLETTIKSMQQSIQTSNTLANSIKKTSDDAFSVLERVTQTRHDLMGAMEDTEDTIGFIVERRGNGGGDGMPSEGAMSLFDMVQNMGSAAYETVKQVEAVEKLANVLTTKVGTEADAILSLNKMTIEAVTNTLQAAKDVVREMKSDSDVTKLLTEYANRVKQEGETVKQLANAIQSDISQDKAAFEVVKNANAKIQALLDAAENQVEMSKRAILTGDTVHPTYVEQNIVDVKSALVAILDATKTSAESAVQKMQKTITDRKETPKRAGEEVAMKSPAEKIADDTVEKLNVPPANSKTEALKSEQKMESSSVRVKEDEVAAKSEQNIEMGTVKANEEGHVETVEKIETGTVEAKEETVAATSAQKSAVQVKEEGDAENLETTEQNAVDRTEVRDAEMSAQKNEVSTDDAKEESVSSSNESSVDVEKAPPKTSIEPTANKLTKSNDGDEIQNAAPKSEKEYDSNEVENFDEALEMSKKTPTSNSVPETNEVTLTSGSQDVSGIADSMKTQPITDHAFIEPHPDLVADAHEATKSVTLELTIPLDAGDLDSSSSEVVHELAKAATNAAEVVHDLVNVIASSLLL